ncbi:conserved hypothetical protein, partial [Ixodes scapularis]
PCSRRPSTTGGCAPRPPRAGPRVRRDPTPCTRAPPSPATPSPPTPSCRLPSPRRAWTSRPPPPATSQRCGGGPAGPVSAPLGCPPLDPIRPPGNGAGQRGPAAN